MTAVHLRSVHRQRQISEVSEVGVSGGDTLIRMEKIPRIVFTGCVSRFLSPVSLVSLALDAVHPCGITEICLDQGGFLEVAGTLSKMGVVVNFGRRLRPVAAVVAPCGGEDRLGPGRASISDGRGRSPLPVKEDGISVVPMGGSGDGAPSAGHFDLVLDAPGRIDVGDGPGRRMMRSIRPGILGVYVDGRRRNQPLHEGMFQEALRTYEDLGVFPAEVLARWAEGYA